MSTQPTAEHHVDPRIERSRRVIREAALLELAESGYGAFTIDSVAKRAGVGRSTVYRHWDGKPALIADALERLNEQPAPDLPGSTARLAVETLLRHLCDRLAGSVVGNCVPALIEGAERDDTVRELHHRYNASRRRTLTGAVAAGVQAGEFSPAVDPELASLALAGAIFYGRFMTGTPLTPAVVSALVDTVLGPAEPGDGSAQAPGER